MAHIVDLPNGDTAEFPDEMNPEQISSILSKQFSPNQQQQENDKQQSPLKGMMQDFQQVIGHGFRNPLNIPRDIAVGLGQAGQNIGELAAPLRKYIPEKMKVIPQPNMQDYGPENPTLPDKILQGAAQYAPFGLAGGAGLAGQLVAGAGYGLTQGKSGQTNGLGLLPEGKLGSGIEGMLINALLRGGGALFEKARPSNILRGNLSPQQLERNLEVTRGTKTGLGDVIESPMLKEFYENRLRHVPFSGATQAMQETAGQIHNTGESYINNLLGKNNPAEISDQLGKGLIKAKDFHLQQKNEIYNNVDKLAEDHGLKLELPNFSKAAQKHIAEIENSNILKFEPEVKSLLKRLTNYKNPIEETNIQGKIVDKEGNPLIDETSIKTPSVKEANILAGKLNQMARQYRQSPTPADRNAGRVLGDLGRNLKFDIKSTIKESGNNKLIKEFDKAEKNYKENYLPFLEKDILKYTEGGKNPEDLVSSFIINSKKSDKANHLNKLMSKLSSQDQNLVRYSYFARALEGPEENRVINPNTLKTLWSDKKLGPNQKKVLIPNKDERRSLDNYVKLVNMNTEAIDLMRNPKTGFRNSLNMILDKAMSLPGKMAVARPMVNMLTNPMTRENLVRKMIQQQKMKMPFSQTEAQTAAQGAFNRENE